MPKDKRDELVDLVRSLMYGTDDMIMEAVYLAEVLGDIDGVPDNSDKNRLIVALDQMRHGYNRINLMNDED